MGKMSVTQQRFLENAVLIAALQLIFKTLEKSDTPLYSLGEIANTTSGGTPDRGRSEYYEGDISWIKSGELNDGVIESSEEYITNIGLSNSSAKIYPEGTLVVALYGATVGKTGILAIDAASNQAVCAVTPINEDVNKYFLFWFLRYKRPEFLKSSFGGAQPNISQKILRETVLPLPSSKLQKQICAYLEAIETRLKEKNSVIVPDLPAPLSKINSTIQKVEELAAKIEEARGLRREAVEETNTLERQAYQLAWSNAEKFVEEPILLEYVADVIDPQPDHRTPAEILNGMPYVSIANIDLNGKIDSLNARKVSPLAIERQEASFKLQTGDIVLGKIGTVGAARPIIVNGRFALSANVVLVQPYRNKILDTFLLILLRAPQAEQQFTSGIHSSAQGAFGIKKMRKLSIPVPPLSTQISLMEQFTDFHSNVDTLMLKQSQTSAELNALLPSILDKAFKGEL